jgi:hypothetical protein
VVVITQKKEIAEKRLPGGQAFTQRMQEKKRPTLELAARMTVADGVV